jgi:predicted ATPase
MDAKDAKAKEVKTTAVSFPPSSQLAIFVTPPPPHLFVGRQVELSVGRVGAHRVQPEPTSLDKLHRCDSSSSDGISDEEELEDPNVFAVVAVAELVDEDERDAVREEIDILRREIQELKQERRSAEVVVAEPVLAQRCSSSMTIVYDVDSEVPRTPFNGEFMTRHHLKQATAGNTKLSFDAVDHLFGREAQLKQLQDALLGLGPTPNESLKKQLVLIGGLSGTGKSALARQTETLLLQHQKTKDGLYVTGKFDERASSMDQAQPYSAVSEACENLCQALFQRMNRIDSEDTNQFKDLPIRIREVLDPGEIYLLMEIIPTLQKIVGTNGSTLRNNINYMEAKHRFQHAFQSFMRLISALVPLVVVVEDLHWVDQASLDLIESLITDSETETSIMLILTYRDNEVDDNHIFRKAIDSLKEQHGGESHMNITEINVQDLKVDDVSSILQLRLGYEKEEAQPLAECVHSKTGGNPFYVKQFLLSLQANQLLTFNPESLRWQCNVSEIWSAARATDNVGALLSEKLKKLPSMIRAILPRVACLGPRFATATAQLVLNGLVSQDGDENTDSVEDILQNCQREGLLIYCGQATWIWEHDSVKEAALLIASEGEALDVMKYEIGELLLSKLPAEGLASSHETFATATLLNSRASLLADTDPRRIEIAKLNLRAGRVSMRASAFQAAAQYLKHGIGLLPAKITRWETYFELSLDLYAGAAEAHFCIGDHQQVMKICDEVLALTTCPLIKKRRAVSFFTDLVDLVLNY